MFPSPNLLASVSQVKSLSKLGYASNGDVTRFCLKTSKAVSHSADLYATDKLSLHKLAQNNSLMSTLKISEIGRGGNFLKASKLRLLYDLHVQPHHTFIVCTYLHLALIQPTSTDQTQLSNALCDHQNS